MTDEIHLDVGGRPTRILQAGSGPTALWLHDTFGNRWTSGHEALARSCQVVAPSLPGFDDSTTLAGIDGPEDVVFWLLDLLDVLGLQKPVMVGCGLGGWMAAELAVRRGDRLEGLVLANAYGICVEGALAEDEFALPRRMLRPLLFSEPDGEIARGWLPDADGPEQIEPMLHARVAAARLAWQFP